MKSPPGGYCTFQGFMIFYCVLAAVFWWLIIALDIFLKVVLERRYTPQEEVKKGRLFLFMGYGTPIALMIIFFIGEGSFGSAQTSAILFCFASDSTPHATQWVTFFVPIGIATVSGLFMIMAVMRRLYLTSQQTKQSSRRQYIRPILFIVMFFVVFFLGLLFSCRGGGTTRLCHATGGNMAGMFIDKWWQL